MTTSPSHRSTASNDATLAPPTELRLPPTQQLLRQVVRRLPLPVALSLVQRIANRPPRPALHPAQQAALAHGRLVRFDHAGLGGGPGVAHAFGPADGAPVLLVHGWGGCAGQMAPLALGLAAQGFHCLALEVTGHGQAPGQRTRWAYFLRDIAALARSLDRPLQAIVGHSAGGLAAVGARALHGVRAARHVCICSPSHPFPPVRALRQRVDPSEALVAAFQDDLARQFGLDWPSLRDGAAWAGLGDALMLCYDRADKFIDVAEGARIRAWCPGATLVDHWALGHTRVLASDELLQRVATFITAPA